MAQHIQRKYRLLNLFCMMFYLAFFSGSGCLNSGSNNSSDDNDDDEALNIFISNSTYAGNLGGTTGADAKCMSDGNYPGSGTYKAMLVTSTTRSASPTPTDWVLKANTEYKRLDGTIIGTTNEDATFDLPLDNAISATTVDAWTGINGENWDNHSDECVDWSSSSGSQYGIAGRMDYVTSTALNFYGFYCDDTQALICVEQ